MPVVSFVDTNGQVVPFDQLESTYTAERWSVPLPLLRALTRRKVPYADISVTELVGPPQIRLLRARHEYAIDPVDLVWASFGRALHRMLELRSEPPALAEEQLVAEYEVPLPDGSARPMRLGGTADHYGPDDGGGTLTNYKTATVFKAKLLRSKGPGVAPEWVAAENCYAHLLRRYGFDVARVRVCLLLRDWSPRERDRAAARFFCTACGRLHQRASSFGRACAQHEDAARADWYPPAQVAIVELPVWSHEETEAYIRGRLELHARAELEPDERLPQCTAEETWKGRRCRRWCEVAALCWQQTRRAASQGRPARSTPSGPDQSNRRVSQAP